MNRKRTEKILFVVLVIIGVFLTIQISNAWAFEDGDMYQLMPDDFGFYNPGNPPCPLGSYTSAIDEWCFNPTFLPSAYLFQKPDGTLTGHDDGTVPELAQIATVHFAAEWTGHAVAPHRTYQEAAFTKYEDPDLGTMVPHCEWRYSTDHDPNGVVASWNFGCSETRPSGYEGTSLQCENLPFQADFDDGNGMVNVPDDVCYNSGIMYVPANPGDPDPEGLVLALGNDVYDDNYFDVRTYDATHPNFGMVSTLGGLTVGMDAFGPNADQISRVEIISVDGVIEQKIVLTTPDIYIYGGDTMYAYTMVFASKHQVAPQYDVFAYDLTGSAIQFQNNDETMMDRLSIFTDMNQVLPPVMKLRKAVLTKNKGIRVKFTAPFDARGGEIRLRILDEAGNIIQQYRDRSDVTDSEYLAGLAKDAEGHYFFIKNNGTVVLDKIKVFIPMEWAGHAARIEYRTYDGPTLRGITFFKLPAPEPVVEEEPEVTVVECPDESGLVSIVDGICVCPDTYNYVDGIGCQ